MVIHSPIFSGSITQDKINAFADLSGSFTGSITGSFKGTIEVQQATFADLSGSFTGSITGSFKGTIEVQQATFADLTVTSRLRVSGSQIVTGSINLTTGGYLVDNVNVLDSAIAFAIALG